MKSCLLYFSMLVILSACSPSSLDDFRHEGESICREFTRELEKIETREQLIKAVPKIKAKFEKLATLMIEVKKFQQQQEMLEENPAIEKTEESLALLSQFKRIYQIESGKEIMEQAQKEALYRLSVDVR